MKQTINRYEFVEAFRSMDRYDCFGYTALQALFDYLEDYEDSTGEEMELDVIAICCDWTNYDDAAGAAEEMITSFERDEEEDDDDYEARALEELQNHTTVIEHDDGVLVESF